MEEKQSSVPVIQKFIFAGLLFWGAVFASHAGATSLPRWKLRSLVSPHFEIIYRIDQRELAERYMLAAEQAYELLIPIFKEAPSSTIVYISDDTDSSNGEATFLPYPMITVYPVLPSTLDSIDDYGDWPLEIMVHEYTHILNMYPAHGFYVPLKYLFGQVVRPNAILPKWYLEGLAVNLESRLTDHGRLRADETHASARALSLGNRLHDESLSRINEQELMTWPYGARPYLFGAWWWNYAQNEGGPDRIETWNQNYARRLPFLLNGPIREQSNKSAEEMLASTAESIEKQAHTELDALQASKPHVSKPVVTEKGEQTVFAVNPSGRFLVYAVNRPGFGTEIRLKVRSGSASFADVSSRRLFKTAGVLRVRWLSERRFVYDALDVDRPWLTYRDIFLYDVGSRRTIRLTNEQRAEEPAPSLDGKRIAFVQNDGGRNRINIMPLDRSTPPQTLVEGGFNQRLSGPEFINDHQFLYILHERAGDEQIFVYDLKDQKSSLWNTRLKAAQNLRRTSRGILVSDARTHVRNIYLVSEGDSAPIAVSNTLTHIETSDYDPLRKELLISELTPEGRRLRSIPHAEFEPATIHPAELPAPPTPTTTTVQAEDRSYQPLRYLLPKFWIPFIYTLENNGLMFQGTTFNADPAGRNSYSAFGAYDNLTQKPSYGFNYTNSSLPTDIGMGYARSVAYLGANSYILQSQTAYLNFSQYWPFNSRNFRWNFGGVWTETDSSFAERRMGPQVGIIYDHLQSPMNLWAGTLFELSQQQFLKEGDYIGYGRTYGHLAEMFQLGGGNKIFLQAKGAYSPNLPYGTLIDLGDRSLGGNYLINLANADFLLRGYPSGEFVGREMFSANLEYSFPLIELGAGYGSFPVFMRAMEIAVFADAMTLDGAAWRSDLGGYWYSRLGTYHMGTGAELRLSTTAGYHLPVSFTLGGYYGLSQRFNGGFMPFIGLGLGDLGVLQNKTP